MLTLELGMVGAAGAGPGLPPRQSMKEKTVEPIHRKKAIQEKLQDNSEKEEEFHGCAES